jgi:hypothetical protein
MMADSAREDRPEPASLVLRSEFATVRLVHNRDGNGDRLQIEDLRSGRSAFLDPLVLEALAWVTTEELAQFMDPRRRWSDDGDH